MNFVDIKKKEKKFVKLITSKDNCAPCFNCMFLGSIKLIDRLNYYSGDVTEAPFVPRSNCFHIESF